MNDDNKRANVEAGNSERIKEPEDEAEIKGEYILSFIPVGHEYAVTGKLLERVTGLNNRAIRRSIAGARRYEPVLNMQDGHGYFRPNVPGIHGYNKSLPDETHLLRAYKKQEESRLKSIGWSLRATRRVLRGQEAGNG